MAFKKGVRILRARDPVTGRYTSAKDTRRAIQREVVQWTGRKFKTVMKQAKAEPIAKSLFKIQYMTKIRRQYTPVTSRKEFLNFDKKIDNFVETVFDRAAFWDKIFSDMIRTKSSTIDFTILLKNFETMKGIKLPDLKKFNFTYYLNKDQVERLSKLSKKELAKEIDQIITSVKAAFMKKFKSAYQGLKFQFSDKRFRNFNPDSGKKTRGAGKRETLRSFDAEIDIQTWNI